MVINKQLASYAKQSALHPLTGQPVPSRDFFHVWLALHLQHKRKDRNRANVPPPVETVQ